MHCDIQHFKEQDWYDINIRPELANVLEEMKEARYWKEVYLNDMPFFTLRIENKIVMIYGMVYGGAGTYYPALMPSVEISKHTKTVIKALYDYYATYVERGVRRLEATCDIMDEKAIRLAKYFGFDVIGIRHNSSVEGHDQVILERLVRHDSRKMEKVNG